MKRSNANHFQRKEMVTHGDRCNVRIRSDVTKKIGSFSSRINKRFENLYAEDQSLKSLNYKLAKLHCLKSYCRRSFSQNEKWKVKQGNFVPEDWKCFAIRCNF